MHMRDYKNANNRHKFISACGRYIYHVAIIDYLCQWDFDKKMENFFKVNFLRQRKDQLSAVAPD